MAKMNTAQEAVVSNQRVEEYTSFQSLDRLYAITKRIIDIVGAIIGLIVSSPLFLLISIFYLFGDSKGPIFFKQVRVGKNGEKFYIYKFRSMIVNAEEKLKADKELYQKYLRMRWCYLFGKPINR
ncbi:lipopolysaccharide/colanic/teichoic acid biosynthesis glycosyltransferase [Anoxybacillus tepidamans]|uniref:Lipopolysaccharide/colanic/teichoic acid biosynthesis glycosyltransferase n=1 Tax=Anoxybacteroides tepidamans TaxID=265948 RepID=A0A7W8INR2_9BACL|nr:lipopolysaccharide/colanic/teichoic acid biosynthesis glycosyltransferase [Anoxybacillus tepidamans]